MIIQFCPNPVLLNLKTYKNAFSSENTQGSYQSLHAFRELVDPLPLLQSDYVPGAGSTETTYGSIINGAMADAGATFVSSELSQMQEAFSNAKLSNLDGIPGVWRPVFAVPHDWYSPNEKSLRKVNFDFGSSPFPEYNSVGQGKSFENAVSWLNHKDGNNTSKPTTKGIKMEITYLSVSLRRSWLNPDLFQLSGWHLGQQKPGIVSDGTSEPTNKGIMPLLPIVILIGHKALVKANWNAKDQEIIREAASVNGKISLGPFEIDLNVDLEAALTGRSQLVAVPKPFLLGVVSSAVPFAPPK